MLYLYEQYLHVHDYHLFTAKAYVDK